ncbi:MAG: TetR family transcriptional regulator [Bdellovibrionota bacterium]
MADNKDSKNKDKDLATKERLVKTSRELFAQKGFEASSVKEIAENADVNVALVSYHFGGKEGLYHACFNAFVDEWTNFLETKILRPTSNDDFRFRLRLLIEYMIDDNLKNPDACQIMRREIENGNSHASEVFQDIAFQFFDKVAGFIRSAQKQGYLRSDIHAMDICSTFFGGIQHTLRMNHMRKKMQNENIFDQKVRERYVHAILEMFLNGMSPEKEGKG